jgi:hypothetical protein
MRRRRKRRRKSEVRENEEEQIRTIFFKLPNKVVNLTH